MALDLVLGRTPRDWSCGSLVLPAKQEKRLMEKVDDVRYDVRRAGNRALTGALVLSTAVGFLAVSLVERNPR